MSFFSFGEIVTRRLKELLPKTIIRDLTNCDYEELIFYHFTLGEYFRNVILDEKSDLYRWFYYDLEIHKKDDMSELMLKMLYLYLKGSAGQTVSDHEENRFRYI
ncbi:MAG: DUF6794 domain-containing protein [Candidatus Howiella sp.]|jgi:hypothetical protein